ncbi:uncharacterized protein LOC107423875 isoform X2 [Ziziphus jujuba]|uniref:Uncharacterized protein LOC107423875 isoform X2 n=1 Tax=Ziziphus jujuba TaxID=326968 RepID=A0ABM3IUT8_ZIZJJ|nr:uncharacterized protein LOC107423875 isoform X2 [Ziziphus jujuba]
MTVLRSREILPIKTTPKTPTRKRLRSIEPSTPAQKHEPPTSPTLYTLSSPSINPDPLSNPTSIHVGLGSDSVSVSGVTRRRSTRLASRVEPGERAAPTSMEGGRRRRKSGTRAVSTAEKEKGRSANGGETMDGEASCYPMGKKVSVGVDEVGIQKLEMDSSSADPVTELSEKESGLGGEEKVVIDVEEEEGLRDSKGKRKLNIDINLPAAASESCEDDDKGVLNLRSGKRVAKRRTGRSLEKEEDVLEDQGEIGQKKLVEDPWAASVSLEEDEEDDEAVSNLRLGKRVSKKRMGRVVGKGKKDDVQDKGKELDLELEPKTNSFSIQEAEAGGRRKGKRKMNGENEQDIIDSETPQEVPFGIQNLIDPEEAAAAYLNLIDTIEAQKRKEKGKEKLVETNFITISDDDELDLELGLSLGLGFESEIENPVNFMANSAVNVAADNVAPDEHQVGQTSSSSYAARMERPREGLGTERYREIADAFVKEKVVEKKKAEERVENHLVAAAAAAAPAEVGAKQDVEDWPGPFRTAMKIIRDRAKKFVPVDDSSLGDKGKRKPRPVIWTPKKRQDQDPVKRLAPSLLELCVMGLAKNADAIVSLEFVPDALRHWLCSILCGSRSMSTHFFQLLLNGSPTEIRVKNCSWLTEEQLENSLQGFDPSNLTVLQLDLCGRCLPDYVVLAALARSSNSMPKLTTLSLTGACRLSDVGLDALVSSAPHLRSINLSQCSFLTSSSINSLANSLGSKLRELYLDDCQSIVPMLTLPALKRLKQLEVLSLAGIESVCDDFITHFIRDHGTNMKKLVLTGCVNLTDSSLKAIAETCSQLSAIDLIKLCKLTDSTLGYLANGCQKMQTLKLCCNQFRSFYIFI